MCLDFDLSVRKTQVGHGVDSRVDELESRREEVGLQQQTDWLTDFDDQVCKWIVAQV